MKEKRFEHSVFRTPRSVKALSYLIVFLSVVALAVLLFVVQFEQSQRSSGYATVKFDHVYLEKNSAPSYDISQVLINGKSFKVIDLKHLSDKTYEVTLNKNSGINANSTYVEIVSISHSNLWHALTE